jgi:hypothetical protein
MTVKRHQQEEDRRQEDGDDGREHRLPRPCFEGRHAFLDPRTEQQRKQHIQSKEAAGQPPCPGQIRFQSERPAEARTVRDPRTQPLELSEPLAEGDLIDAAADHGVRMSLDRAADRLHITADVGIGPKLEIAKDDDGIALHFAVDVGVAEHRRDATLDRSGHARIAEDRDDVLRTPLARHRSEHRDDRIGRFAGAKMNFRTDAYVRDVFVTLVRASLSGVRFVCRIGRWRRLARSAGLGLLGRRLLRPRPDTNARDRQAEQCGGKRGQGKRS